MTFTQALILARDEGHWIRSVEEGNRYPHRWIKLTPSGNLSYVFTDRPRVDQRTYMEPGMGNIERYLGEWEAIPNPYPAKEKR